MSVDMRMLRAEDVPAAQALMETLLPADIPEPDFLKCIGRFSNGRLTAFFGIQRRVVLEPCVMEQGSARDTICWADGMLASIPEYEFVIDDRLPWFQKYVEEKFGLEAEPEKPHRTYIRRRAPQTGSTVGGNGL